MGRKPPCSAGMSGEALNEGRQIGIGTGLSWMDSLALGLALGMGFIGLKGTMNRTINPHINHSLKSVTQGGC